MLLILCFMGGFALGYLIHVHRCHGCHYQKYYGKMMSVINRSIKTDEIRRITK